MPVMLRYVSSWVKAAGFLTLSFAPQDKIISNRTLRPYSLRQADLTFPFTQAALIFPHWACQLATNRFGSGLHIQNVTYSHLVMYWQVSAKQTVTLRYWHTDKLLQFSRGWIGYFLVCSMIKVSVCYCLLQIRTCLTQSTFYPNLL